MLQRWVGARPGEPRAQAGFAGPARAGDLLDEAIVRGLMAIDDDGTLMDELVAARSCASHPARLAAIRAAAGGDATQLERAAHSLYGTCSNLGCRRMAELCARLETLGRSGSVEGAPALAARAGGGVRGRAAAASRRCRRATRAARRRASAAEAEMIRDALRALLEALFRVLFTYDCLGEEKIPQRARP